MKLTDQAIKKAAPKDKKYKISDSNGLYLLVLPTGGKYFKYDFRFANKRKTLALGVYPYVSLKEAREKRDEARKLLNEGRNPSDIKRAKKHNLYSEAANTFKSVAFEWFEKNKAKWTPRHAEDKLHKLERDIFPYMGDRPIKNITPPELLFIINKIENRGAIETAHRTKNIVGEVFAFALATGRAERNIALDLTGALTATPKAKHRAAITDPKEVGALLRAIEGYEGEKVSACALKISPYLMLRPIEVATAEWSEIDLENKLWKIPAEKMKMSRPHIIPLASQVIKILEELFPLAGKYVFPSIRTKSRHINASTVNAALRRLGYTGEEMCAHGFRGMASTLLHENGFDSAIIEIQLAHSERNKVKAAYNHAKYLEQRKTMMQWWADYLDTLKKQG